MKKITLLTVAIIVFHVTSCKKDWVCECTDTTTHSNGDVTTNPDANTSYKDMKKSDAKSRCQKSTTVVVSSSGGTTTYVNDCKLK